MSDPERQLWSNNPNSPQITRPQYFSQKASFAGSLLGAIGYGVVVILFFKCMGAFLNRPREMGIRWGFMAHAVAMFSIVTTNIAMSLHVQSISYIDNREFPGTYDALDPGPLGYQFLIYSRPINVVPYIMFFLNNWLADGLLLYRCCVIFAMNYWVTSFPCLMYVASVATGAVLIYQTSQPAESISSIISFGYPFFIISFSLNILLTLMIVTRIIWHARQCRIVGLPPTNITLYTAIVTMLIESFSLHSVSYLLYIVPWAANSAVSNIFFPILVQTQVIAPFLIIIRVANRGALTSSSVVYGDSTNFMETNGETSDEHGMGVENMAIHEVQS